MGDNIMWTDFERFNETHFYRNKTTTEKILIEPEIEHPDDRSVCIHRAVLMQNNHDHRWLHVVAYSSVLVWIFDPVRSYKGIKAILKQTHTGSKTC